MPEKRRFDGDKIRNAMLHKRLTIESLAALAELSKETVNSAINRHTASERTILALSKVLGGGPDDYLFDAGTAPMSLPEAADGLLRWEHTNAEAVPLDVDSLAIDLANGWGVIHTAINHTRTPELRMRVLMLTPDEAALRALPGVPAQVLVWAQAGAGQLATIRQQLHDFRHQLPKPITLAVKHYARVPTLHGIRVRYPAASLLAVTECGYSDGVPPAYHYGPEGYQLIAGDDPDPARAARRDEFARLFAELWDVSGDTVFEFEGGRKEGST